MQLKYLTASIPDALALLNTSVPELGTVGSSMVK